MTTVADVWGGSSFLGLTNQETPGFTDQAECTRNSFHKITRHRHSSVSTPDRRTSVINALLQLNTECSTEGWDGYQAAPVGQCALNNAYSFFKTLNPNIPAPELSPEPDGEIALEWYGDNNSVISISIGDSDVINYAAIFPDKNKLNGTESLNGENKELIEKHIYRVIRSAGS